MKERLAEAEKSFSESVSALNTMRAELNSVYNPTLHIFPR